jgi:hypothetical protein
LNADSKEFMKFIKEVGLDDWVLIIGTLSFCAEISTPIMQKKTLL